MTDAQKMLSFDSLSYIRSQIEPSGSKQNFTNYNSPFLFALHILLKTPSYKSGDFHYVLSLEKRQFPPQEELWHIIQTRVDENGNIVYNKEKERCERIINLDVSESCQVCQKMKEYQ